MTQFIERIPDFLKLMRFDRPIGTFLVLWPTLWSLWLAAKGFPPWHLLLIFVLGVILMRAAGCVINDYADRKIDGKVKRTQQRPLVTGKVSPKESLILFSLLCAAAFGLVLFTNLLTMALSVGALVLAASYPFMKRHTYLPQVVLGAAFAWSIPMAFAAQTNHIPLDIWLIYISTVLWVIAYDTFYAMVDREDDLKIGVKSTAILFGDQDRVITGTLQLFMIVTMILAGRKFGLGIFYYLSIAIAAGLFVYQQWLIKKREKDRCFKAFLNNNWVGAVIFVGILLDLGL